MNEQDEWMQRITVVLETPPEVAVPTDFSARLMVRLPRQPARRTLPAITFQTNYGQLITLAMLAVVMLGMVFGAVLLGRSMAWKTIELTLFVQFSALTLWLVLSRRRVF